MVVIKGESENKGKPLVNPEYAPKFDNLIVVGGL